MVNLGWIVALPLKLGLLHWQKPNVTELQCVLWALEKKASSLGRYGEWRSESQFQGSIPSPSPDVSKLQRERENRGTDRKEKSHSGWHGILLGNFGYTWSCCWSTMMPAEVSSCVHEGPGVDVPQKAVPQLCSKANVEVRSLWSGLQASGAPWHGAFGLHPLSHAQPRTYGHLRSVWTVHWQRSAHVCTFQTRVFLTSHWSRIFNSCLLSVKCQL